MNTQQPVHGGGITYSILYGILHQSSHGTSACLRRCLSTCTLTCLSLALMSLSSSAHPDPAPALDSLLPMPSGQLPAERQVTRGPGGRILTHTGIWSPDSQWILYDVRSDPAGDLFDGTRIERVQWRTGETELLYTSRNGAHCGVASMHPGGTQAVFILGPEYPTPDWQYSMSHRQGILVEVPPRLGQSLAPRPIRPLDARNLTAPFTPGALRGGTHVHVWDAHGDWLSFTYNDALQEQEIRDVGVCVPGPPVRVPKDHARNHDGDYFATVVTRTVPSPPPGTDEIKRAFEEGWVGTNGYLRPDGSRQQRAVAFQGQVVTERNETISEVFLVDLPENLRIPGEGPPAGSGSRRPSPPRGVVQRRLTFTAERRFPGIQGTRHWLRSSPDGSRIAFLAKDDAGVSQLWTVSPAGGQPQQLTRNRWPIASAFTWSPDGRWVGHVLDQSVAVTDTRTGVSHRLTPRSEEARAPRPEACVFSPDGRRLAYMRRVPDESGAAASNQIFVVEVPEK